MTLKTTYNNQKGFTLIEMIIVITVISIIAGIASIIILEGLKSYQTEVSFSDIHNQGRLAIERMAREIRMIRSATATDISTMTATNLQFNDVNGNTNVLFQRSGASAPYSIVRNNVQSVSFSYYQQDGVTVAAAATQVWFIQIDLTTVNRGETLSMRVRVHPRNF
jgi:prepilin-type N-terminal cleavage/methylation domain-containing protein